MDIFDENLKKYCFFCSKSIDEKKSQEHIIPNSLLGKLGIKEEKVVGVSSFQYSRVKVPAHKKCNSEFGSEYENKVIELLEDTKNLYEELKSEERGILIEYGPSISTTMLVSTWLSKVYYGLFYNDLLKVNNEEAKEVARSIIDTVNFRMMQNAYKDKVGFCLPSSLYVFKSETDYFNLITFTQPQTILMKINKLIMILCIEDGFLTKNYLNRKNLEEFRENLLLEETINNKFPIDLYSLSEITALRLCIPKSPAFIYANKEIINMSFSTSVQNPSEYYKVDSNKIAKIRNEILVSLNVKIE